MFTISFYSLAVNQISTFINITLLDVNDNAPLMPDNKQYKTEFSESDVKVNIQIFQK